MKTTLQDLQHQFQDYILNHSPAMGAHVVETPEVSAEVRLGIYSYAYAARLLEVLEFDFPGLHTLLGDEAFHQLGHLYLQAYPSTYRSVRWFATDLDEFLANTDPYRQYPALSEMAAFEWGIQHVLDAADAAKITTDDIAAIPTEKWENIRLTFHPALRRLNCKWNVIAMWQAVDEEREIPELQESEWPIAWMLWRAPDLQVLFASIPVAEAWALDTMISGGSFGAMCEGLCEWIDAQHAGAYAATLLKNWLEQGIIVKVSCEG